MRFRLNGPKRIECTATFLIWNRKSGEITRSLTFESAEQKEQIIPQLREVLKKRREIVDRLRTAYTRILRILRNMGYTQQQIFTKAETFAGFLDQHLLWLRTSKSINFIGVSDASLTFLRLFMGWVHWKQTFLVLKWSILNHWSRWIMALLGALLLFALKETGHKKAGANHPTGRKS